MAWEAWVLIVIVVVGAVANVAQSLDSLSELPTSHTSAGELKKTQAKRQLIKRTTVVALIVNIFIGYLVLSLAGVL